MIRDVLSRIGEQYRAATQESFAQNALAQFVRNEAPAAIRQGINDEYFQVRGSAGQGTWSEVPWIAVFDPLVTTSAMRGYYVVYLFHSNMSRVFLSLNQGTTIVREEFGAGSRDELRRRARLIKSRLRGTFGQFDDADVVLGSRRTLPLDPIAEQVITYIEAL